MNFWSRILSRVGLGHLKPSDIAEVDSGSVTLEGQVELLDPDALIGDPISGDLCVLAYYEAHMPGYAQRLMIAGGGGPMNLVAKSAHATDFLLRDASGLALVRVRSGANLLALHHEMLSRHGFEMRAATELIKVGDRVRVRGQVAKMMEGSPMRREDYQVVVSADAVERLAL